MKKVIIRCISMLDLINNYHIIIYDKTDNKIYDKYINNSKLELYLDKGVYKAIIVPNDIYASTIITTFLVKSNNNNYSFNFVRKDNLFKITAILVDKKYNNLPIERGKIKLWQDHIQ